MRIVSAFGFSIAFIIAVPLLALLTAEGHKKCVKLAGGTGYCPEAIFAVTFLILLCVVGLFFWHLHREVCQRIAKRPFGPSLAR